MGRRHSPAPVRRNDSRRALRVVMSSEDPEDRKLLPDNDDNNNSNNNNDNNKNNDSDDPVTGIAAAEEMDADKVAEMWAEFAADHYEMVEQLPLELHRNSRLLRELDHESIGEREVWLRGGRGCPRRA